MDDFEKWAQNIDQSKSKYPNVEELARKFIGIEDKGLRENAAYGLQALLEGHLRETAEEFLAINQVAPDWVAAAREAAANKNEPEAEAFINSGVSLCGIFTDRILETRTPMFFRNVLNMLNRGDIKDEELKYDVLDLMDARAQGELHESILKMKLESPYVQFDDFKRFADLCTDKESLLNLWRFIEKRFDRSIRNESGKQYPNVEHLSQLYNKAERLRTYILSTRARNAQVQDIEFFDDLYRETGTKYDFDAALRSGYDVPLKEYEETIAEKNLKLQRDKLNLSNKLSEAEPYKNSYLNTYDELQKEKTKVFNLTNDKRNLEEANRRTKEEYEAEINRLKMERDLYKQITNLFGNVIADANERARGDLSGVRPEIQEMTDGYGTRDELTMEQIKEMLNRKRSQ